MADIQESNPSPSGSHARRRRARRAAKATRRKKAVANASERKRAQLRKRILQAAMKLYAAHGFGGVTLREIGTAIDMSAPAIYYYFHNKNEIFLALAEEGIQRLARCTISRERKGAPKPPLEILRDRFWGYYEFSRKHPRYFMLIYVDPSVPDIYRTPERVVRLETLLAQTTAHIQTCIDSGVFPRELEPIEIRQTLAAIVLGASVWLHRHSIPSARADDFASRMLNMAFEAVQAGLLPRAEPIPARQLTRRIS